MLVSFYVPTFHPLPISTPVPLHPRSRPYSDAIRITSLSTTNSTPPTATISLMRISPEGLTAISQGDERVGIPGEREWVHQVLADLAFHPIARFSLPSAFSSLLTRFLSSSSLLVRTEERDRDLSPSLSLSLSLCCLSSQDVLIYILTPHGKEIRPWPGNEITPWILASQVPSCNLSRDNFCFDARLHRENTPLGNQIRKCRACSSPVQRRQDEGDPNCSGITPGVWRFWKLKTDVRFRCVERESMRTWDFEICASLY